MTKDLGLGNRTPWLGIVITALLLAGVLNTLDYHDVRVLSASPDRSPTYPDIGVAWRQWLANARQTPGVRAGRPLPMVLVAAPGGGIRASYWTAAALDRLVSGDPCGRAKIFAVSAVSGGALGAVTWLQSPDGTARDEVSKLSQDSALAASTAALFLRDLPQAITGFSNSWRDRASVMEDAWAEQTPELFGTPGALRSWSALRSPQGWTPAVVLNGSSVTDGCRVLVTNVGRLPTASPDCRSATPSLQGGPASGTLDATDGLGSGLGGEGAACSPDPAFRHGEISIVTAALLSARFPLVSPSGVLERCLPTSASREDGSVTTTHDVDGGYFDNSGLLSLLAIWSSVEAELRSCHADCPTVEPWILVLDNHYRSTTVRPPESDQGELAIPFQTFSSALDATSQERLEQVATVDMTAFSRSTMMVSHVVRIRPQNGPGMSAPLGWVLSPETQGDLDGQLKEAFECTEQPQPFLQGRQADDDCLPAVRTVPNDS